MHNQIQNMHNKWIIVNETISIYLMDMSEIYNNLMVKLYHILLYICIYHKIPTVTPFLWENKTPT